MSNIIESDSSTPEPWEPDADNSIISLGSEIDKQLRRNTPELLPILHLSELFLAEVKKHGILTDEQLQDINAERTQNARVARFMDHLRNRPIYMFHRLLLTLVATGQGAVVRILGYRPEDYTKKYGTTLTDGETNHFLCNQCSEPLVDKACIMTYCSTYICGPCKDRHTCSTTKQPSDNPPLILDEAFSGLSQARERVVTIRDHVVECGTCQDDARPPFNHMCQDCDQGLCLVCLTTHQHHYPDHQTLHLHPLSLCCHHQSRSTKFCTKCKFYLCLRCLRERCSDHQVDDFFDDVQKHKTKMVALKDKAEMWKVVESESQELVNVTARLDDIHKQIQDQATSFSNAVIKWQQQNMDAVDKTTKQWTEGARTSLDELFARQMSC